MAATGRAGDALIADKEYDFTGWLYRDPVSQQIVGASYHRDGPRTLWFDENYRAVQKAIDGLFPGQVAQIIGSSEKGSRFLIRSFSDRHPTAYHWVDLENAPPACSKPSPAGPRSARSRERSAAPQRLCANSAWRRAVAESRSSAPTIFVRFSRRRM